MKRQRAKSENYRAGSEDETVFLTRETSRRGAPSRETCIGDLSGEPRAAVIDAAERFVIGVGFGIILYRLAESFAPYIYGAPNAQ